MTVNLTKGGNISLTKENPDLSNVTVGLGWDVRTTTGANFDLDASAVVADSSNKALSDQHFVFFGNLKTPDGSVEHSGDNLTGRGDGDDEQIQVDLTSLSSDADKVIIAVNIYQADQRGQSFGQVRNAYIRVINTETQEEMARYDLTEDASTDTAMVFGELYRHSDDWKFRAVGQGYVSGLVGITQDYGINL